MKLHDPEPGASPRGTPGAALIEGLCTALDKVPKKPYLRYEDRRGPWTREVKTALCRWGVNQGFYACAHSVKDRFRDLPKKKRPRYEWLFDVTCLTYRGRYLDRVPLVAECEWGNENDIHDDFEKLLVARAEIRVMVFDADQLPKGDKFRKFEKYVRRFGSTRPEDTYLLAAYSEEQDGFEYRQIRDGRPSSLPSRRRT